MNRSLWMRFYEAAPEAVQNYLLDTPAMEAEDKAQQLLSYDHDAWNRLMDVVWDEMFLRIPEPEFRARIAQVSGDRDPKDVEKALLRHVVLPLADLVPWDVERRLQELGVPLGEIQSVPRVSLRPVSYGAAVRRIAAQAKVSLISEESVRRCRELLISYVKSVRLIEQVKEQLQRSQAEGGVGLTRDQSEAFAKEMIDILARTEVVSEQEYVDWFTSFQREIESERIASQQIQRQTTAVVPEPSPETVPSSVFTSPQAREAQAALADAIEATYRATAWTGDEYLAKRLQNIISTRIRDVRNQQQVQDVLARDQKVGGMGFSEDDAEKMADIIEEQYKLHREAVVTEERQNINRVQEQQGQKISERKARESQAHAEWFEKKIRSGQRDDEARQVFFQQMKEAAAGRVQSSPNAPSGTGAPPTTPMVDSVSAPTRLMGLTEELQDTSVDMFRRLARSPHDAAVKLIQKLDALKAESFERWTEGVQAWRASPLQQAYLALIGDSFRAGRSVVEIIEQKAKTDPNVLTSEEVGAIMEINTHAQL
ncbi:hypothetical protein KBD61_02075 [Patescibacteria group bacterium]|nr:hypothetical protein [Patescibacteria group bacterium]MBP9709796.1 hypothetical protein [Patescibacteria group bacterium]